MNRKNQLALIHIEMVNQSPMFQFRVSFFPKVLPWSKKVYLKHRQKKRRKMNNFFPKKLIVYLFMRVIFLTSFGPGTTANLTETLFQKLYSCENRPDQQTTEH